MAKKRVTCNPWDEIYSRLRVIKLWKCLYPPRPTAADLDKAEQMLGCRLPASYRAFAERFGLGGELAGWFRAEPLTGKASDLFTVTGRTGFWREELSEPSNFRRVDTSLATQLVAIGSNVGGDSFIFNTDEVTDRKRSEYRVYELGRLGERLEAQGDTFAEFIDRVAKTFREYQMRDDPESAGPEGEISYSPYFLRRRLPFTRKLAAGWRTSTVVAVGKAIVADRAFERLPILADALEEAGCRDPHLLEACRSGNPQSDGGWVIDVMQHMVL